MGPESHESMTAIRDRLEHRREELSRELAESKQNLIAAIRGEAEEHTLSTHPADETSDLVVAETSLGDIHTVEAELAEIDTALVRIHWGMYSRCADCGKPIDPAGWPPSRRPLAV